VNCGACLVLARALFVLLLVLLLFPLAVEIPFLVVAAEG
jgi:hypothetical protein